MCVAICVTECINHRHACTLQYIVPCFQTPPLASVPDGLEGGHRLHGEIRNHNYYRLPNYSTKRTLDSTHYTVHLVPMHGPMHDDIIIIVP